MDCPDSERSLGRNVERPVVEGRVFKGRFVQNELSRPCYPGDDVK